MRAAAVIFAGSGLDDPAINEEMDRHLGVMRGEGAAVVHLSPYALGEPEVSVDNAAGIGGMVAALVGLGHRRIAFLAGPRSLYVARERLAGYRRGLEDAGIDFDERLVVRTGFDRDGGTLGVDTLLAGDAPFSAICCANDLLAIGALQRLAELGIDVPGEVSVAGFDDISTASLTAPSLSTVRLPLREMGRLGFEHADRLLAGDRPERQVLPIEVVPRAARRAAGPPARRSPDGRRAGRSGRAGHRQQPGDRRRSGGQGGCRGGDGGGPLPRHGRRRCRGPSSACASAGGEADGFPADLGDGAQAEALVEAVIGRFGRSTAWSTTPG